MEALIAHYLAPIGVRSLLVVSPRPHPALAHYCLEHDIRYTYHHLHYPLPSGRVDLAVVLDDFEVLSSTTMSALLGTLKNVLSEKVWVLTPTDSRWQMLDFIALGFRLDPLPKAIPLRSYSYNLETYNHQRDWNNPRFWANPEQWHKRW